MVVDLVLKNNMVSILNDIVFFIEKGNEFINLVLEYIIINKDEKIEYMKDDFFFFRG